MKKKILVLSMVLALVAALVVPTAALAGTTEVTGTQASVIEVTAPSAISFGTFSVGWNIKNSDTAGTVTCNGTTWHVTAKDLKEPNAGRMTSGGNTLAGTLQIGKENTSYVGADVGITYDSNPTTLPFYVKQNVLASDKAGAYTITITFTGTIGS